MKLGSRNYCKKQTSLAFTDMEGTGAVGATTGHGEEPNLQPCEEAKSPRKPSIRKQVQSQTGDRHTFPSSRRSDSHHGRRAPGASVELQQPAVPGCSSQKETPQPSSGYSQEGEEPDRIPQHQSDVRECVAMVAAEG